MFKQYFPEISRKQSQNYALIKLQVCSAMTKTIERVLAWVYLSVFKHT